MNRALLCLMVLIGFCGQSSSQDFDSDFRMCNGLPRSQVAFAMALGGDLQSAAINILQTNKIPDDKQKEILQKLFFPVPSSLLQLTGRIDLILNSLPPAAANQIRTQFNLVVASKLSAAQVDNIVCSISLLSYREASDVFGKRIANQYGVVQVTIRNTDSAHEFLLHQIDFSFGDTLDYYATRDRKIARGVAEKGQVIDPRNITVRVLEGIGSVAGPTTNIFSNDAKLASSIYNSSFLPAVKYVFPDLTVQQIGRLDDMGFSSGASTMVIPKNGAISVVAFVPFDSFLLPKLSQYEAELANASADEMKKQLDNCAQFTANLRTNKIDMAKPDNQAQASTCNALEAESREPLVGNLSANSVKNAKGQSTTRRLMTMGLVSSPKNMKDFDPAVVLLLQRDLHIMIAGSHIQELTTQLMVTSVTCSIDDPALGNSSVNCALGGNNLNLVSQGRLIDKTDSTFSVSSSALSVSKDDTAHGKIIFPACQFVGPARAGHSYFLELSTATGAPQINPSEQIFKAPTVPTLQCTRPTDVSCQLQNFSGNPGTSLSLAAADGHTITLSGAAGGPYKVAAANLPAGTYTPTVTTTDGKSVQLCPVSVP